MMPMPADFAVRLAGGLAFMLLLTSWRQVPPAYFRTIGLVMMSLFVVAALATIGANTPLLIGVLVAGAFIAYLASAIWGLGLPRVAVPLTVAILLLAGGLLLVSSRVVSGGNSAALAWFNAASRLTSAGLLGASMAAMLLGHHYLTAPAMSIAPLKRFVAAMAWTLAPRTVLAAIALVWSRNLTGVVEVANPLFLAMRWGMGVLGPAVAIVLAWQTVKIRSTQSATGILYIGVTLVLFGELAGLILGRGMGIEL